MGRESKITAGLDDALRYARGDLQRGKVYPVRAVGNRAGVHAPESDLTVEASTSGATGLDSTRWRRSRRTSTRG